MSKLFSPARIGSIDLANRLIVPPMCQYSAVRGSGMVNDWHRMHYGNLAQSGASLLILEATGVQREGVISDKDLGIWNEEQAAGLKQLVESVRSVSEVKMGIQLAHAGRKASTMPPWLGGGYVSPEQGGWETVSATAQAFSEEQVRALSLAEIAELRQDFAAAAQRSKAAGFDVVELHAAHGYLLHQFLSPLSNQRQDEYGGSLENRCRLVLEVFETMRQVLGSEIAFGIRISATDWVHGGWDIEQSILLAAELEKIGCDFIHVSSGGLDRKQAIPLSPNYQVPHAAAIREAVDMPVIAVGLITEPEQAEAIVATGQADFVGVARGMLWNPRWGWHAAAKLQASVQIAAPYHRAEPRHVAQVFGDYFDCAFHKFE